MNSYINKVAPQHCKTSCDDHSAANARYSDSDFGGCYRCTLISAARSDVEEEEPEEPEDPRLAVAYQELLTEAYGEGEMSPALRAKVEVALGLSPARRKK